MFINLLPHKRVIQMLIRRRLRQWALVWAAILIAGLLILSENYRSLKQSQRQFSSDAERVRPLTSLQAKTSGIEKRLRTLQQEVEVLEAICVPDRSLALLAILGDAVKSPHYQVQIQRMSLAAAGNRAAAQPNAPAASAVALSRVSLHGIA
ncbi:MAG: hypothetical protein ACF788_12465 [Novipirellula sp. JB048]